MLKNVRLSIIKHASFKVKLVLRTRLEVINLVKCTLHDKRDWAALPSSTQRMRGTPDKYVRINQDSGILRKNQMPLVWRNGYQFELGCIKSLQRVLTYFIWWCMCMLPWWFKKWKPVAQAVWRWHRSESEHTSRRKLECRLEHWRRTIQNSALKIIRKKSKYLCIGGKGNELIVKDDTAQWIREGSSCVGTYWEAEVRASHSTTNNSELVACCRMVGVQKWSPTIARGGDLFLFSVDSWWCTKGPPWVRTVVFRGYCDWINQTMN